MARAEELARWMRQEMKAAGASGFVVGLSGGVDSAVVARLAQLAAPGAGAVLCALLPCHSDPQDESDAGLVARQFSLTTIRLDLSSTYDAIAEPARSAIQSVSTAGRPAPPPDRRSLASIQPRLRMAALYFLAESLNYLVAGSVNRSELAVGSFTKHGDYGADLLPLGRLAKGEVRALARHLGVPASIVDRGPGAGLGPGQTDEDELGFTYQELERYVEEGPQAVPPALAMKIERQMRVAQTKVRLPPMPDDPEPRAPTRG